MRLAVSTLPLMADQMVKNKRMIIPQVKQKHTGTKNGWMA
jgi:hypothetical protein